MLQSNARASLSSGTSKNASTEFSALPDDIAGMAVDADREIGRLRSICMLRRRLPLSARLVSNGVINWRPLGMIEMRRRLQRYLPIFLIALLVQVLAPIGVCWAAAAAASDPFGSAEICHSTGIATDQPTDQGGQHSEHAAACSLCCLASAAGASIDGPGQVAFAAPYRELVRVVWQDQTLDLPSCLVGLNAQARAPPFSS